MNQDLYDPPTYGGTPQQEAHAEMVQIFGSENPDKEYILTDYDVWEKNPYYHGPAGPHPEDYPHDDTEDPPTKLEQNYRDYGADMEETISDKSFSILAADEYEEYGDDP